MAPENPEYLVDPDVLHSLGYLPNDPHADDFDDPHDWMCAENIGGPDALHAFTDTEWGPLTTHATDDQRD